MNLVKQIIKNEITEWLYTCNYEYPLTRKFIYSMNDELTNVHEKLFDFISGLPRMNNYEGLLKENSYDTLNEYFYLAGPFLLDNVDDFFNVLRDALVHKIYLKLEENFDAIICACYMRLLYLNFDSLVQKYPQINDGLVIKAISDDVKEYHFKDVTLNKLIDVIKNVIENLIEG